MPLPSPQVLGVVIDDLAAALFPQRLALSEERRAGEVLAPDSIDYFVGHRLDACLRSLAEQIRIELTAHAPLEERPEAHQDQAMGITRRFARRLPPIRRLLDTDLDAAYRGDPVALGLDEVLVCYPGMQAITAHRSPMRCMTWEPRSWLGSSPSAPIHSPGWTSTPAP